MNELNRAGGPGFGLRAGLLVLMVIAAGSCEPKDPGRYTSREKGFSIAFPQAWELKENELGLDVVALSPLEGPGDEFRDNVSVASSEMTKAMTADDLLDANLAAMMRMITDFSPRQRGPRRIGNLKAAYLTYTHRQGQFKLTTTVYAVPGTGRAYLIYCTAETGVAARFQPAFDQTVMSFRVSP